MEGWRGAGAGGEEGPSRAEGWEAAFERAGAFEVLAAVARLLAVQEQLVPCNLRPPIPTTSLHCLAPNPLCNESAFNSITSNISTVSFAIFCTLHSCASKKGDERTAFIIDTNILEP